MGILVCYDEYTYDVINEYHLDFLLENGCITGYDESGEWVRVDGVPQGGAPGRRSRCRPVAGQRARTSDLW